MDLLNNKLLAIHSEVKTFSEHWLRTISDMARCSMLQFTAKQNFIRISERMQHGFTNRIPPSHDYPQDSNNILTVWQWT